MTDYLICWILKYFVMLPAYLYIDRTWPKNWRLALDTTAGKHVSQGLRRKKSKWYACRYLLMYTMHFLSNWYL